MLMSRAHFIVFFPISIGRECAPMYKSLSWSVKPINKWKTRLWNLLVCYPPLPIPNVIFEDISMDFITGLPLSQHRVVILLIIDCLSKYGHFIALPAKFNRQKVVMVFVQEFVYLPGFLVTIVCDHDSLISLWILTRTADSKGHGLLWVHRITHSDGQTRGINKCLEMYLRCIAPYTPPTWFSLLSWEEFWYNMSYQHSSKLTPFEVVYGCAPPIVSIFFQDGSTNIVACASFLQQDRSLSYFEGQFLASPRAYKD